jgi:hypothetical protein
MIQQDLTYQLLVKLNHFCTLCEKVYVSGKPVQGNQTFFARMSCNFVMLSVQELMLKILNYQKNYFYILLGIDY